MAFIKLLFFTFFGVFLLCVSGIAQSDDENNATKWHNDMKNRYYDQCIHFMSEESRQELDDNYKADNEEIRRWKSCVAELHGYTENSKINVHTIMEDVKKYFPDLNPAILYSVESYARMCKIEAEKTDVAIDVIGIFFNCVFDRC
ncbi:uncharacterized protein [Chelonus insularis]|uniref:uncharacterized protein n=1 Tax=Chelonus insularis TaxID=460826 RepID=UPI00158D7C1B|nr:uncharacterized protein LOC118073080 [Chelonus insularis]